MAAMSTCDARHNGFFGSIGHARLDALNPSTIPTPNMPSPVTNYEQLRATLGYGAATKPGFSGGINLGYDLNQDATAVRRRADQLQLELLRADAGISPAGAGSGAQ